MQLWQAIILAAGARGEPAYALHTDYLSFLLSLNLG